MMNEKDETKAAETKPAPKPSEFDRLHSELVAILDMSGWNRDAVITHSVADLSWLVSLAEEGLKHRVHGWKQTGWGISEAMSAGDFRDNIERFVDKIIAAAKVPPPKMKKPRKTGR